MCKYCEVNDIRNTILPDIMKCTSDDGDFTMHYMWDVSYSDSSVTLTPELIIDIPSKTPPYKAYCYKQSYFFDRQLYCIKCGRELKEITIAIPSRKVLKHITNIKELTKFKDIL